MPALRELVLLLLAFALGTGAAELLGAINLGTSMTFGAFALVGVALLLIVRPRD